MKSLTYGDHCRRVSEVVEHIHQNLDETLNVADLATRGFLSPFHFQKVFRQVAGENCVRLVRRLRLERAAWQLQNTTLSVSEIAVQAGFESLEAFSRAFRRRFAARATQFKEARWGEYRLLAANGAHFSPKGTVQFHPIARKGREVPFTIESIEAFPVTGRLHPGAPHLMAKTCRLFGEEVRRLGVDLRKDPIVTYAPLLGFDVPVSEVKSYVGVCVELPDLPNVEAATLGGGCYLVARFVGSGPQLGDFWLRLWKEALPASGYERGDAACYQLLQFGLYANAPSALLARIHISVKPK